jgi:hypothetical protein
VCADDISLLTDNRSTIQYKGTLIYYSQDIGLEVHAEKDKCTLLKNGVSFQKLPFFIVTAVKTSGLTSVLLSLQTPDKNPDVKPASRYLETEGELK